MADHVLEDHRLAGKRAGKLPARTGVYFVLALALFGDSCYLQAWGRLTAALGSLGSLGLPVPPESGLAGLRRRIGARPLKDIFEILAGPLGRPGTPGIMFGKYRTVSFDGCKSLKVPGTKDNLGWLGKLKASNGVTGYPALMLMTLVETGTRALPGAVFGPPSEGEAACAAELLHLLNAGMLLLLGRGFGNGPFLAQVAATRARFLVRLTSTRRPPVLKELPDGSFLSVIGGTWARVITATVTVTCAGGFTYSASYRLATNLLNPRKYPAGTLIRLYHERWEHEVSYLDLRHALLGGRSCGPATRRASARKCGPCSPFTRRSAPRSPTPSRPCPGSTPTAPAGPSPSRPPAAPSSAPATSPTPAATWPGHRPRRPGPPEPSPPPARQRPQGQSPLSRWHVHPAGKPRDNKKIDTIDIALASPADQIAGGSARPAPAQKPRTGTAGPGRTRRRRRKPRGRRTRPPGLPRQPRSRSRTQHPGRRTRPQGQGLHPRSRRPRPRR